MQMNNETCEKQDLGWADWQPAQAGDRRFYIKAHPACGPKNCNPKLRRTVASFYASHPPRTGPVAPIPIHVSRSEL